MDCAHARNRFLPPRGRTRGPARVRPDATTRRGREARPCRSRTATTRWVSRRRTRPDPSVVRALSTPATRAHPARVSNNLAMPVGPVVVRVLTLAPDARARPSARRHRRRRRRRRAHEPSAHAPALVRAPANPSPKPPHRAPVVVAGGVLAGRVAGPHPRASRHAPRSLLPSRAPDPEDPAHAQFVPRCARRATTRPSTTPPRAPAPARARSTRRSDPSRREGANPDARISNLEPPRARRLTPPPSPSTPQAPPRAPPPDAMTSARPRAVPR